MNRLSAELKLILRGRLTVVALVLLALVSLLAVGNGLRAVEGQRQAIDELRSLQAQEVAARVARQASDGDAGYAGYYTFHATYDPPSTLAFAALGMRDVAPYLLRVRLLGLHSQLYESESVNAELALPGRFDFAFVLVFLLPLVVIAISHDLVTSEREAGRLRALLATPGAARRVWHRRVGLRYVLVLAALLLPFALGAAVAAAGWSAWLAVTLVVALYTAFWFGLSLLVAAIARSSALSATGLVGAWLGLVLLLPTLANAALTRAVPVAGGVDLVLEQRELVHSAWDLPKAAIFEPFFQTHPQFSDTSPVTGRFHWKWYYAMHQVGDERVAADVQAYRQGLDARERWTQRLGWILPGVGTQVMLHRLADSDLSAHLAFLDQVGVHHARLRHHMYPYFFDELPFGPQDFARVPAFEPRPGGASLPWSLLLALALAALVTLLAGLRAAARVR